MTTLCVEDSEFLNVKPAFTCTKFFALKGFFDDWWTGDTA